MSLQQFILFADSSTTLQAVGWAGLAVVVGLVSGFVIGRTYNMRHETRRLKKDREKTLRMLMEILKETDILHSNLETHTSEVGGVGESVASLNLDALGASENLQQELLGHVSGIVQSNRRLQADLASTRYKLSTNARELDRSRAEARTDSLSGVGNRKAFDESLAMLFDRYQYDPNSRFAMIVMDIDHFKRINDTFGHQVGDSVIVSTGKLLTQCVRPGDQVARLGGDEFAVLLNDVEEDIAPKVAARIRSTIELTKIDTEPGMSNTVLTVSLGMAIVRQGDTPESLFERADQGLYKSKENGRNLAYVENNQGEFVRVDR